MNVELKDAHPATWETLQNYLENHVPTGSFLEAVLSNDLRRAVEKADSVNLTLLPLWVNYLYNNAPAVSWGSPRAYREWINVPRA